MSVKRTFVRIRKAGRHRHSLSLNYAFDRRRGFFLAYFALVHITNYPFIRRKKEQEIDEWHTLSKGQFVSRDLLRPRRQLARSLAPAARSSSESDSRLPDGLARRTRERVLAALFKRAIYMSVKPSRRSVPCVRKYTHASLTHECEPRSRLPYTFTSIFV